MKHTFSISISKTRGRDRRHGNLTWNFGEVSAFVNHVQCLQAKARNYSAANRRNTLTAPSEKTIRERIESELQKISESGSYTFDNPTYEAFDIVIKGLEENGIENAKPEDITLLVCLMLKKPTSGKKSTHEEECLDLLAKSSLPSNTRSELKELLQSPLGIWNESLSAQHFTIESRKQYAEYKNHASTIAFCLSAAHNAKSETIYSDSSLIEKAKEFKKAISDLGQVTLSQLFHCANPDYFAVSATTTSVFWQLYKFLGFRLGDIEKVENYFALSSDSRNYLQDNFPHISNLRVYQTIASIKAIKKYLKAWGTERTKMPTSDSSIDPNDEKSPKSSFAKNTILYGPPGTGKTYSTVKKAVEICDSNFYDAHSENDDLLKKKYDELTDTGQIVFTTFHQSYGYEDFIEGIRPDLKSQDGILRYTLEPGIFKKLCDVAKDNTGKNYVIVIDEINRGNVSRIFGELITLLEESKRLGAEEAREAYLPYSGEPFGVPQNVYLLGTMNTADRSLTQLDTALRRRFDFVEMPPEPELLDSANSPTEVDLQKLLEAINKRIERLYDREHMIGHSYLMKLGSFEDLKAAFSKKIIPLLQEYFYDNYQNIRDVLNDDFIEKSSDTFQIVNPEKWEIKSFTKIYEPMQEDELEQEQQS